MINMKEKKPSAEDLLGQIENFEKTLDELKKNITSLKEKILKNKEAYGSDISQWPKSSL